MLSSPWLTGGRFAASRPGRNPRESEGPDRLPVRALDPDRMPALAGRRAVPALELEPSAHVRRERPVFLCTLSADGGEGGRPRGQPDGLVVHRSLLRPPVRPQIAPVDSRSEGRAAPTGRAWSGGCTSPSRAATRAPR